MEKTLADMHTQVQIMKDQAVEGGLEEVASLLSCASLYLRNAHDRLIKEGELPTYPETTYLP
jgi:hypothetical protein